MKEELPHEKYENYTIRWSIERACDRLEAGKYQWAWEHLKTGWFKWRVRMGYYLLVVIWIGRLSPLPPCDTVPWFGIKPVPEVFLHEQPATPSNRIPMQTPWRRPPLQVV